MTIHDRIMQLYGLESNAKLDSAIDVATENYACYYCPSKVRDSVVKQLKLRHFKSALGEPLINWWSAGNTYNLKAGDDYLVIWKLLLIPGKEFNPLINVTFSTDEINTSNDNVLSVAYPHPKNSLYYLLDEICEFPVIIIRPEKTFRLQFGNNDFTAIPVGIALEGYIGVPTIPDIQLEPPIPSKYEEQTKPSDIAKKKEAAGRIEGFIESLREN